MILGQYHTTPPTLPDKGQEPVQMDTRGNIKVTLVGLNGTTAYAPVLGAGTAAIGTVNTKTALTAAAPTAATVGATSAEAVAVNAARKSLVLVNTSANWISLAFGAAAVLYSGITLAPNGGTWVMDEYTFSTAQIRAIASMASSNLAIQEFS